MLKKIDYFDIKILMHFRVSTADMNTFSFSCRVPNFMPTLVFALIFEYENAVGVAYTCIYLTRLN